MLCEKQRGKGVRRGGVNEVDQAVVCANLVVVLSVALFSIDDVSGKGLILLPCYPVN